MNIQPLNISNLSLPPNVKESKIQSHGMFCFKAALLSPDKAIKAALLILLYHMSLNTQSPLKFKAEQIKRDCVSLLFIKTLSKENHGEFEIITPSRNMIHTKQEEIMYDGVCCALRADFANSYLLKGEAVRACAEKYRSGVPPRVQEKQHTYEKASNIRVKKEAQNDRECLAEMLPNLDEDGKNIIKEERQKGELLEYSKKISLRLHDLKSEKATLYTENFKFLTNNEGFYFFFNPRRRVFK